MCRVSSSRYKVLYISDVYYKMFEQVELLNPWIYETENACANFSIWLCDVITATPSV